MRYVLIDLSSDNYLEQPKIFGGYAGEHNETVLQVKLPKRMLGAEYSGYRFEFQTSEDNKIICPLISSSKLDDDILSFPLAEQLTVAGNLLFNIAAISLNGSIASLISKTNMVTLYIGDSSDGNDVPLDPNGYKDETLEMIDERVAQSLENLEEKEILTTTEFNDIAVNTEVDRVKLSGDLFKFQDGILTIGSTDENAITIDFDENYSENDNGSTIFNIGTKTELEHNSLDDKNSTKMLGVNFNKFYTGDIKRAEIHKNRSQVKIPAGAYKITYDYYYYTFDSSLNPYYENGGFSYKFSNGTYGSATTFGDEIVDETNPQNTWNNGEMFVTLKEDIYLCVTLNYSPYHIYLDNIKFYKLRTSGNLVLNNCNSITTFPKGIYQLSYDYRILEGDLSKEKDATAIFGMCSKEDWDNSSYNSSIKNLIRITPNMYDGMKYETRHEQMGKGDDKADEVDFSYCKLDTWYKSKNIFQVKEDDSVIVISTQNLTNYAQIKNIKFSELSEKTIKGLYYTEINRAPNSRAIWLGMKEFVNDTVSRTQQHAHLEAKALSSILTTEGKKVLEWNPFVGAIKDESGKNITTGGSSIYHTANTENAGNYLIISPDKNSYDGTPKPLILTTFSNDGVSLIPLSLPKGTYIAKYKWRQQDTIPDKFVNFNKYCNRMPYLKFVNQLNNISYYTGSAGVDISGNLLKYQGNYFTNQWYEDSYIFTIDDNNYGGYFGIKVGYLQFDIHIANVEIYELQTNVQEVNVEKIVDSVISALPVYNGEVEV